MDTTSPQLPVSAPVVTAPAIAPVGLDVSKDTLDACLLLGSKRHEKQFANEAAGYRQLLRWALGLAKLANSKQIFVFCFFCQRNHLILVTRNHFTSCKYLHCRKPRAAVERIAHPPPKAK